MAEGEGRKGAGEAQALGLADAVELVRAELQCAAELGARSSLAFRPESVEIEFEIVFERSVGVERGVGAWVVSLGSAHSASEARAQRLKVTLVPFDRSSGHSPEIADFGPE